MPPGWDGIHTIKRIWQEYPELQVVICTAYSDYKWDDIIANLEQIERLLILKKPFENVEVFQLAHALTEKWNLTRHNLLKINRLEKIVQEQKDRLKNTNEQLKCQIAECGYAEQELGKFNEEMQSIILKLELANKMLKEFAPVAANDLKSPSMVIENSAD
jgi:DNA-binding LytR/AlgR family response regulator